MKTINKIYKAKKINMGGVFLDQALPVENLEYADPFLLIHHWKQSYKGGKMQSESGVGPHPHRGFAPVTLIFEGAVYHQDSIGNKSLVGKGGTQWMNSGKGIIHSERPSKNIAETGGDFEIIQFWVNAPAVNKLDEPNYQALQANETPIIISDGGLVRTAVIAGEFAETKSNIKSYTKLLVLRFEIDKGGKINIPVADNFNVLVYQLDGKLFINNDKITQAKDLIHFDLKGNNIAFQALEDTRAILLAGEPINEKIVSYGPFVMNTKEEIFDAVKDYNSGKMGILNEVFNSDELQDQKS